MNRDEHGSQGDLAPVIPLFGGRVERARDEPDTEHARREARFDSVPSKSAGDDLPADDASADRPDDASADRPDDDRTRIDDAEVDSDQQRRSAEDALLRKLRARSLSVSEARHALRAHETEAAVVDDIVDDFCRRRYLDDEELARQLVMSGHERKGQGRVALGRTLAQRGVPRDIADTVLAELPDDDFERALEFARGKARAMARLDPETAKRRLSGQLARRGYSGSLVSKVVGQALREQSGARSFSGVRFE